jgi:ankyrin repeat protein
MGINKRNIIREQWPEQWIQIKKNPKIRKSVLTMKLVNACKKGNIGKVKELLYKGADINAEDDFGATPLGCAVINHHVGLVDYLIDNGADVNRTGDDSVTLLMLTCVVNDVIMARKLIDRGIDTEAVDHYGETALSFALRNNSEDISKFLQDIYQQNLQNSFKNVYL